MKFANEEKVELHHIDGNHNNCDRQNLLAIHTKGLPACSCQHYVHMSKGKSKDFRKLATYPTVRPDFTERGGA